MIKTGDKVKFLDDVGGGVVTGFINKDTVNVENEDGFEIPYPVALLVNVSAPELNAGFEKKSEGKKEETSAGLPDFDSLSGTLVNGKDAPDFYFCFVPQNSANPSEGEIELFLVNDSNYTVMYHYTHVSENVAETVKYGNLQPNSKISLEYVSPGDLQNLPGFGFEIIWFKDVDDKMNVPVTKVFRVNPVRFYKSATFMNNNFFTGNALLLQISDKANITDLDKITEQEIKEIIKEKEQNAKPERKVRKRTKDIVEIDLHINSLIDSVAGLSNREILEIQKDKVVSEMNDAIKSGAKRIVFIHGVGQGVLKQEVANILKSKFRKFRFQDASFKEYGYGATMVMLRR